MVKICSQTVYPDEQDASRKGTDSSYDNHFEKYPYELSIFQKHAIQGIVDGNHVLVCAPTGSGKSLPAEFAIEYFTEHGKKVIYTSPIKALGNQKYNEFTTKYPHISFGLITGDIKINPSAQVLIMTAEILLNKLTNVHVLPRDATSLSSFDIDINTELGCVVMDEVHYINDSERGKVWEETIMLLPPQVQMVMLSATIDSPEKFAGWCETCKPTLQKIVVLAHTYVRIVPLTHYAFIVTTNALYKSIKDKDKEEDLKKHVFNQSICLQTASGEFLEPNYHLVNNTLQLISVKQVNIKRAFVLNELCKHLVQNNMLPALCFVLSRKRLEQCAQEITVELLEDDSKVGYIVRRECEQIIRRLPNHQEYLRLPEYMQMVALLEKGVAVHHAGIMPVLREMVEILYSKGYIKLLFATETFAVGLNMPTKTTIFTDVSKFDGASNRQLYSHEYTQMAGRAGRRGIDEVGHVIHLPNLYSSFGISSFKAMLSKKSQTLASKFRISYNLIFNSISKMGTCTVNGVSKYVENSMIKQEIFTESHGIKGRIETLEVELAKCAESFAHLRTPLDVVQNYLSLLEQRPTSFNKRRKEIDRGIAKIIDDHKHIEKDKLYVVNHAAKLEELESAKDDHINCCAYIDVCVRNVIGILMRNHFIFRIDAEDACLEDVYIFSEKGKNAQNFKESNCLLFSMLYGSHEFNAMTEKQIACFFSCFTNVTVSDDNKTTVLKDSCDIKKVAEFSSTYLSILLKEENDVKIKTGTSYEMHFDLIEYVGEWWEAKDEPECKQVLQQLVEEKGVSLGEFVKALLKINNIVDELSKVAEINGDVALLSKLEGIPKNILKFVATNQSLYI
jgi:superfamily II RNA helicase